MAQVHSTPVRVDSEGYTVTIIVGAGGAGIYYGSSSDPATLASSGTFAAAGSTFLLTGPAWVVSAVAGQSADLQLITASALPSAESASLGVDPTKAIFGADATGVADATAAIRNATAAARLLGTHVAFPPGTYTVSDRIHDNATTTQPIRYVAVVPGTVTIQRTAAQCIIETAGSKTATVALSADSLAGATSLPVASLPTGGLNPDDFIELASTTVMSGNAVVSEIVQVQSVTGSGPYTINLYGPLEESYTTAATSTIARVDYAAAGTVIRGIAFRQTAQNRDSATFPLIRLSLSRDFRFDQVTARDADVPGIEIKGSICGDINNYTCENLTDNLGSNFIGYGINLTGNCRDIRVLQPRGRRVRHVVTTNSGGVDVGCPRHITVTAGKAYETSAGAWNTHKEGKFVTFDCCESHNDKFTAFYVRAPYTTIINPIVIGPTGSNNCVQFAEGEASDGVLRGGTLIAGPTTQFPVLLESPRCTIDSPLVVGGGNAKPNIFCQSVISNSVTYAATDTYIKGVRSRDPAGSFHIQFADGCGTNNVIDGGFYNHSTTAKSLVNATGTSGARVTGSPRGLNLTALISGTTTTSAVDNQTAIRTQAGNYTATDLDDTIVMDATSAARTLTLPTAVNKPGKRYIVKKKDSSANAVTIATSSSQTIDGAATQSLTTQYQSIRVMSDGTNWAVV